MYLWRRFVCSLAGVRHPEVDGDEELQGAGEAEVIQVCEGHDSGQCRPSRVHLRHNHKQVHCSFIVLFVGEMSL